MKKIKLEDVIEAIELCTDESTHYYSEKDNLIVCVFDEYAGIADDVFTGQKSLDDLGNYADWQIDIIKTIVDIEENYEDYINLPNSEDLDEYELMKSFCYSLEDNQKSGILLNTLNGSGAFRRFKDKIYDLDLQQAWYDHKENSTKELAIRWCKENNIEFE